MFRATDASLILLAPAARSTLQGPGSNSRQSDTASGSSILPRADVILSPQLWEYQAQSKHSTRRAEGSPRPAAPGEECRGLYVFC